MIAFAFQHGLRLGNDFGVVRQLMARRASFVAEIGKTNGIRTLVTLASLWQERRTTKGTLHKVIPACAASLPQPVLASL